MAIHTPAASVAGAVIAAQSAFEAARDVPPATRKAWLGGVADALEANADELIALAHEETHLPVGRLTGELTRTAFQLRLLGADAASGEPFGATIDHSDPGWGMGPRPDLRRVGEPLGVVGVFGASNFPFAFSVLGGDSASGLAAGCAVVHKAHPAHERLARETARIAVEALAASGAPDGLFALVEGHGAGIELVQHPVVKAIGFTGSTAGGQALAKLAAERPEPIPFYGELGSTNPVFVTETAWAARRDAILAGYVGSFTLAMGQFCTKPGFLVVPAGDRDALVSGLTDAAPTPPHAMLSSGLRDAFERSRDELEGTAGFELLMTLPGTDDAPPATVLRASADTVIAHPELLEHEMFGPASVVVEYDDPEQLEAVAERIGGQLTAGVQAEDGDDVAALLRTLSAHAGRVLWNGWPTGVTVSYAQQHGGPFPATTAPATTSVGTAAITRFLRPVAYQDLPDAALPAPLKDANPWGIARRVDGILRNPESAMA